MKYVTTIVLIILTVISKGQDFASLHEVNKRDDFDKSQAIIYGNFIQRLGFSSGGFPQDIRLINIDTKEIFTFRVKPTFKSSKENTFMYFIKPGNYAILNYFWTQSKWYGGKMFTEPIFKGIDATKNFEQKIKSGEVTKNDLTRFAFSISENSIYYLGTWHFDKALVSFTDDKLQFDKALKNEYKNLDLSDAKLSIPN